MWFNDVLGKPKQWYRFILSIFSHVGIVHIVLNLFTQLVIPGEIERKTGRFRIIFIYFISGIFRFIFGGNFSAEELSRMGYSGSLFLIIALSFLNLLNNWKQTKRPKIQLVLHLVDIIVNFVLRLLPGIDNFSHVDGFSMGLLLDLAIKFNWCKYISCLPVNGWCDIGRLNSSDT